MKKTHIALLAAAFASLASTAAFAAENTSPWSYDLGYTQHRETYKERDTANTVVMKETADLYGIKGSAARKLNADGKLKITGEFAFGTADYVGSYQGGEYGDLHAGGLDRYLFETTAVYTHAAPAWNGFGVKGGLGYRRLADNLQDAGSAGYKRTNDRVYAIIGVEQAIKTANWTITPSAEYKHSLWSQNKTDILGGINHRQHGNGGELAVAFAQNTGHYPVTIRPFYRLWDIADSNVKDGFYEPRNKTSEVGFDLAWGF